MTKAAIQSSLVIAILATFSVSGAKASDTNTDCSAVTAAVADFHCAQTELGVIISETPFSPELVRAIARAEKRFAAAFGQKPDRYLAVFTASKSVPGTLPKYLTDLPTFTWSTQSAVLVLKAIGHGKEVKDPSDDQILDFNIGTYPHELGHFWSRRAVDANATDRNSTGYGSTAPDWFDEASAFLVEDDNAAQNSRRIIIGKYYRGSQEYRTNFVAHIDRLLIEPHPVTNINIEQQNFATGNEARITAVAGPATAKNVIIESGSSDGPKFTDRVRMFADYLIERSRGKAIFGSLARAYHEKQKFEDWLKDNGGQFNLPSSTAEVQQDWEAWFAVRYGR